MPLPDDEYTESRVTKLYSILLTVLVEEHSAKGIRGISKIMYPSKKRPSNATPKSTSAGTIYSIVVASANFWPCRAACRSARSVNIFFVLAHVPAVHVSTKIIVASGGSCRAPCAGEARGGQMPPSEHLSTKPTPGPGVPPRPDPHGVFDEELSQGKATCPAYIRVRPWREGNILSLALLRARARSLSLHLSPSLRFSLPRVLLLSLFLSFSFFGCLSHARFRRG